ncbi:unnamed protein product [Discula destructiva]
METSLTQLLREELDWRARLRHFAMRGIQEDDVHHWLWILKAENTDAKVDRLVSSNRFKPVFVLMAILRTDEHMVKGATLAKIYDYIAHTYIAWSLESRREWKQKFDSAIWGRTLDSVANMTPDHFMLVITRLVHHCLRTFPSSLPMIARLVVEYISAIGDRKPKRVRQRTGYGVQALVFNHALTSFRRMPPTSSLANLPYNWQAQKTLLGYSASLKRPYVITRHTYRAIRMVILGLKKSENEKMAASRHVKTWPPYIRQLDGTDEARDQGEYLSRSVKAGILKQSEGYAHDLVDYALDRTGGALPGQSVAIQTRSSPPGLWRFQNSSLSILSYWAAKVRATRDAYEAWQIFHQPPLAGVTPDFQVYAEMFSKLFAADVDEEASSLPGDGKETHPPHLTNLTDLERERVAPCSPDELYNRMLRHGQRPVHHCLSVLLRNAPSVQKACQYLNDSPLNKDAVRNMTASLTPEYQHLARVPIPIFDAYISLLCNQQGRKRWTQRTTQPLHPAAQDRYGHLKRAIRLVCARLGPRRKPAVSPWHTIMRALAHHRLVMQPTVSWAHDDVATLKTMIDLFKIYLNSQGLHPVPFDCLCRCILKVLRDELPTLLDEPHEKARLFQDPSLRHLIADARCQVNRAYDMVKAAFAELAAPVTRPQEPHLLAAAAHDALPPLYHELSASHIRAYLEVIAKFRDVQEGVRVMDWVLNSSSGGGGGGGGGDSGSSGTTFAKAQDPAHKQWAMMREAFVCFRALVEASNVDPATVARIEARFAQLEAQGGAWRWPSAEDVREYVQWRKERETWPEVLAGGG